MSDLIEDFRKTIRKLKPDGPDGFEGLMAAVLSALTERSFTLASAGSQRGRDGQSALDGGTIVFEAKRYDDTVPKDQIYTKVFEIAADKTSATELFILGATCPVSAQHINTMTEGARRFAMSIMVLAWPDIGLADLATLLAMTPDVSVSFLAKHTDAIEAELALQVTAVAAHPQFSARSAELLAILQQPSMAPAFALMDNEAWLSAAFTSRARARSVFGQALCPEDQSVSGTVDRVELRTKVANTVFAKPDGAVIGILGADGNGKSWIFAQAWSRQPSRPLTVVIVPDDIGASLSPESCNELLISKLIDQTGETSRQEARERWLKHFQRWQNRTDGAGLRLVVFVDGINQRESVDWLRFIDAMSLVLARLGGRLVFSCRQLFYRDNLENKLVSPIITVDVPEWTDQELDQLLRERGSSISVLDPTIVRSLRNPRIFGVAAALFKADEIREFGELSVNRLLFEHIRTGSPAVGTTVSSKKFSADICSHAESIVERLKQRQCDGLNEFEMPSATAGKSIQTVCDQFIITSAGRFFEVLEDDPSKYVLKDEGLPLALGLALVRKAREAKRQGHDVEDALSILLDPITALDRTSDILLGAILAAVLEESEKEIVAPLVRAFVMLQNLNAARYPEFRSLFGRAPEAFLAALEACSLTRDMASNLSWLTGSVNELRGNEAVEAALVRAIHRWLNMYSLSPERMMISHPFERTAEDERRKLEREKKLSTTMESLSQTERELLEGMVCENRGNYSDLGLLAFKALVGRPLAPFAESMRNWCFATSINGGYRDHHEEFDDLLHFNLVDWEAARDALRNAANLLRGCGVSNAGRWALVYVLRATGDSSDAQEAERIGEELAKDHNRMKSWRRIEDYCATDPCDPASDTPENIEETAKSYGSINPAELHRHMGYSLTDHFFSQAQPGLARFRPEVACEALRAFADQAVTRPQSEFRQAVFTLMHHTAALESRMAPLYVDKAREIAQAALDAGEDKNDEGWVAAQYALAVAFPHMTGDAQFDALIHHPKDKTVLLDLCYLLQPVDANKLERTLDEAVQGSDGVVQVRAIYFAGYSETPLTAHAKKLVLELLASQDVAARHSVLLLIRAKADPVLLRGLLESGWSAASLDIASLKLEMLHGSLALVLAAEQGMITLEACLDRIAPSAYGYFVERLGSDAAAAVADRLSIAIQKTADFRITGNLPEIEQNFEGPHWPTLLSVSDRESEESQFERLTESSDAWYERQKRNREVAETFERELTMAGAHLLIHSVTSDLVAAIDKVVPAVINAWYALFMKLDADALSNVHNAVAVVAAVISKRDAAKGVALFNRLKTSSPHVRVTFGHDPIDLDIVTIWEAADNEEMKALRFERLDRCGNDEELAMEVLAAIRADRLDVLRSYVIDRRSRPEPAYRARAAMVAGLSPDKSWALETIAMLKDEHGFLKGAYQGAKYAMERYQWSQHWAFQMRNATDPKELWRYAVLLSKIVDGRFRGTDVGGSTPTYLIKRFGKTLEAPIRNRIQRWKDKRRTKLFGMRAPNEVFVGA